MIMVTSDLEETNELRMLDLHQELFKAAWHRLIKIPRLPNIEDHLEH